jgi:hypothetical protein
LSPPASPVPGWSSGDVWTLSEAIRRGTRMGSVDTDVTNRAIGDFLPSPHVDGASMSPDLGSG